MLGLFPGLLWGVVTGVWMVSMSALPLRHLPGVLWAFFPRGKGLTSGFVRWGQTLCSALSVICLLADCQPCLLVFAAVLLRLAHHFASLPLSRVGAGGSHSPARHWLGRLPGLRRPVVGLFLLSAGEVSLPGALDRASRHLAFKDALSGLCAASAVGTSQPGACLAGGCVHVRLVSPAPQRGPAHREEAGGVAE